MTEVALRDEVRSGTDVLRAIVRRRATRRGSLKIDIAEGTVKVHLKAILRKIRVQNRTQAAVWGLNNGSHTQPEVDGCLCSASPSDKKASQF
jgi:DNA-binding CsgD family transcriptional regulator